MCIKLTKFHMERQKGREGEWERMNEWTDWQVATIIDWIVVNDKAHVDFREKIGGCVVTVAVTPNGYADAITDGKFVMPEERRMEMSNFLDIMEHPDQHSGVFYIQKQNSNFTDEFREIIDDVESDIPWGTEAFGGVSWLLYMKWGNFFFKNPQFIKK